MCTDHKCTTRRIFTECALFLNLHYLNTLETGMVVKSTDFEDRLMSLKPRFTTLVGKII